jgi:hypothetical protein
LGLLGLTLKFLWFVLFYYVFFHCFSH